jgi:cell wall-associated NlpC family hydrolase
VHAGYVHAPSGESPDPQAAFSLGAELRDCGGRLLARLPWGARVSRNGAGYRLPDGRHGLLAAGELLDADVRAERFPPCAENVARTSFRWLGAPYLWGGTTQNGVDCSGYVQAIFRVHGVPLPRDSRMIWAAGRPVDDSTAVAELHPADLLFFDGESPQVSHVALSLGGGALIHAALANGGVDVNDLSGELPFDRWLRAHYVGARRVLAA